MTMSKTDYARILVDCYFEERNRPHPEFAAHRNVSIANSVGDIGNTSSLMYEVVNRIAKKMRWDYLIQFSEANFATVFLNTERKEFLGCIKHFGMGYTLQMWSYKIYQESARKNELETQDASRAATLIYKNFVAMSKHELFDVLANAYSVAYRLTGSKSMLRDVQKEFDAKLGMTIHLSSALNDFKAEFGEDAYMRFIERRGCIDLYDKVETISSVCDQPIYKLWHVVQRGDGKYYLLNKQLDSSIPSSYERTHIADSLPDSIRAHVGMLQLADQDGLFIRDVGYRHNSNHFVAVEREINNAA